MSLLSGLLGNATEVDVRSLESELSDLLIEKESIEKAYMLIRDYFVFTTYRFIFIDKQGITGKKAEYHSIPYGSVSHFSTETAGHFDLDAELKIWIRGQSTPFVQQFKKGSNLAVVQKTLASYVLTR